MKKTNQGSGLRRTPKNQQTMNAKNQTPAQILNLLRESETRDPERHADKTVVLKYDEKTTTETFGFFKAEAHKRPTDAGWSYDDQIEPGNEIHIWRTNYDKPGDRTTPETTTLVFETSHEARTQAADHLETIVREAGMTRTDAYRDNAKGTDHARYTLEVPADQADDTGRSIALDMTANGIRTSWHVATEPGPDPNPEATPEEPTETLTLTTPDTFCSAQVKATAALAGFTRTDETTWTRTATKAEADRIFDDLPKALRATPATTEWYLKRDRNSDEEEPNQIPIWSTDDDPDTRKEARTTDQDVDLLDPQVLRAELNRTKEILTQTKAERDQARNELKATIDAHEEKPITLNGRETQILDALIEAGAIKQARTLFYERDVIQAKLRTHTELDGSERETLLGLVRDANENEIPWTNDEIPL